MKKSFLFACLLSGYFFTFAVPPLHAAQEVWIGVLAPRGELKATTRWSEFGKYMSKELAARVKIVPLTPPKLLPKAKLGTLDFVLTHPPHTVALVEDLGAAPLATLNKKSGSQFAGVIVAKKGSGIKQASDLYGKKVMSLKFKTAAGAYIFQTYHLKKKGIDVHKDFASMTEGKKQDDLLYAVRAGVIDAAFVRSGLLEAMDKEAKIDIDEFQVVDPRSDSDFPFLHTTELYPEWYFTAVTKNGKALGAKAQKALFGLKSSDKAAKKAKIVGFVEPLPLTPMKNALKALRITPYN